MAVLGDGFDAAVVEVLMSIMSVMVRVVGHWLAFDERPGIIIVEGDCDGQGDERSDQGEDDGLHVVFWDLVADLLWGWLGLLLVRWLQLVCCLGILEWVMERTVQRMKHLYIPFQSRGANSPFAL